MLKNDYALCLYANHLALGHLTFNTSLQHKSHCTKYKACHLKTAMWIQHIQNNLKPTRFHTTYLSDWPVIWFSSETRAWSSSPPSLKRQISHHKSIGLLSSGLGRGRGSGDGGLQYYYYNLRLRVVSVPVMWCVCVSNTEAGRVMGWTSSSR